MTYWRSRPHSRKPGFIHGPHALTLSRCAGPYLTLSLCASPSFARTRCRHTDQACYGHTDQACGVPGPSANPRPHTALMLLPVQQGALSFGPAMWAGISWPALHTIRPAWPFRNAADACYLCTHARMSNRAFTGATSTCNTTCIYAQTCICAHLQRKPVGPNVDPAHRTQPEYMPRTDPDQLWPGVGSDLHLRCAAGLRALCPLSSNAVRPVPIHGIKGWLRSDWPSCSCCT